MRFRLRTLLIVLALGPPLLAAGWWGYSKWQERQRMRQVIEQERQAIQYGRYMQEERVFTLPNPAQHPEAYESDGRLKSPATPNRP